MPASACKQQYTQSCLYTHPKPVTPILQDKRGHSIHNPKRVPPILQDKRGHPIHTPQTGSHRSYRINGVIQYTHPKPGHTDPTG
ncbi:hypothetical protein GDO81_014475 [Engystomops pustulosus]|uniref:Uncharacterized protein n=1 Tax=Engystomops pustulosus TaxID=76066 RepID=A0AAV7BAX3_ENGPU|nr:hypothetical protein GDO81_014475 [Engystomops pustulosus]